MTPRHVSHGFSQGPLKIIEQTVTNLSKYLSWFDYTRPRKTTKDGLNNHSLKMSHVLILLSLIRNIDKGWSQ